MPWETWLPVDGAGFWTAVEMVGWLEFGGSIGYWPSVDGKSGLLAC